MRIPVPIAVSICLAGLFAGCNSGTAPATARITGVILARSLGPQSGVTVLLGRGAAPVQQATTATTGGFEFTGLAAGDWVVTLDPHTLVTGCLTPQPLPVYVAEGGAADASITLDYVLVPGVYAGSATAVTQGAITDTMAVRGLVFFPSGPFDVQVTVAPLGTPHRFELTFDESARSMSGPCWVSGSQVDSLQLHGYDQSPGLGALDYDSQPPDVYPPSTAPPDSLVLSNASGKARISGQLTTYWHLLALHGDLRQNVVLQVDVTRAGP
jgi:hypothetical protein